VLDLDRLTAVRDGHLGPATVGKLPMEGAWHVGAKVGHWVYLSRESLLKNLRRHPDVSLYEYLRLPDVLTFGLIATDRKESNCVVAVYQVPDKPVRYKGAVKCAAGGYDLWVTSFHRLARGQTRRLLSGATVLRTHVSV
jgi:hypothetical protein